MEQENPENINSSKNKNTEITQKYSLYKKIWYTLVPFFPGRWTSYSVPRDELNANKTFWTYSPFIMPISFIVIGIIIFLVLRTF